MTLLLCQVFNPLLSKVFLFPKYSMHFYILCLILSPNIYYVKCCKKKKKILWWSYIMGSIWSYHGSQLHIPRDSKGQKVKERRLPFLLIYEHCRLVREKDVKGNTKLRWNGNDKSKQTEIRRLLTEHWPNLSLRWVTKILNFL